MATTNRLNRLRVTLGKPIPELNAHKCLHVHQGEDEEAMKITFKRTIRVPDDGTTYNLPPDLGNFPLYNIDHYKKTLSEAMALKGGCFMPIHRELSQQKHTVFGARRLIHSRQLGHEALWINFQSTRPFAIKVLLGGINAISGEPIVDSFATVLRRSRLIHEKRSVQDYVVVDPDRTGQLWLDGIAKQNGEVMQFVSVPMGSGYSVEAQVAQTEAVGAIQILVVPIKRGPTQFIYVKQLNKEGKLLIMVHSNASIYEFMCAISAKNGVPVGQMRLLYNSRHLEKSEYLGVTLYGHTVDFSRPPSLTLWDSRLNLVLNLQGGGLLQRSNPFNAEMSVGVGGKIKQSILRDPHAAIAWDTKNLAMFNVQLLTSSVFQRVTGNRPPPTPVTAQSYADAAQPYFSLPTQADSGIQGLFSDVKSIQELDAEKGILAKDESSAKELNFPTIQLDKSGLQQHKFIPVSEMESDLSAWNSYQFL
ncbi:hypothetical protein ONS95_012962 [Cadophora gregata]|uniref:uncharacterized protein n=1 Tax=Cadophora gregata TaxID=51156 RepID=UPI0026DDC2E6|nr:uncharacterized protein ONS95_012962 [Cadophora gregata]KAK0101050.1 hypothetical protein ONS96_006280 [Cadophora gregata f. sp. sojae]KAK0115920.1 hypothetical protein ONS95_012962 [Cadophora gregata]